MISDTEQRRMLWAARRGMLELDLLLEPFVRECYTALTAPERQALYRLLLSEDQALHAWLLQRAPPADPELAHIVGRVLAHDGRGSVPEAGG